MTTVVDHKDQMQYAMQEMLRLDATIEHQRTDKYTARGTCVLATID